MGDPYSLPRLIGRVDPAKELEQVGLKRLSPNADPIDPAGAVAEKVRAIRSSWVGL